MKKSLLILILFSIFLTSCGKKGALSLPEEPQEVTEEKAK
ncbi:MAG: hypothetical protein K0R25_1023 [Rickettsiaceae bacterium]|jgi:predicted small lipoprotein YifL|nr:hypothetical protein [Rickettsiaceae bacterium]